MATKRRKPPELGQVMPFQEAEPVKVPATLWDRAKHEKKEVEFFVYELSGQQGLDMMELVQRFQDAEEAKQPVGQKDQLEATLPVLEGSISLNGKPLSAAELKKVPQRLLLHLINISNEVNGLDDAAISGIEKN